jgi:carbon monoxide dehydrogenase subunit G
MALIERHMEIAAPRDAVFDYLEDPGHVPEFAPGVARVEEVQRSDQRVGDTFKAVYSVMGISFPVRFTTRSHERPHVLRSQMDGAMSGEFRWELQESPSGDRTAVTVRIDYTVKGGVLGRAANAVLLERMNEKNAERMLENLKMVMEQPGG